MVKGRGSTPRAQFAELQSFAGSNPAATTGSTVILCSPMVRISLFHREDRGSIPRIGIMGARNINNKDCLHIR